MQTPIKIINMRFFSARPALLLLAVALVLSVINAAPVRMWLPYHGAILYLSPTLERFSRCSISLPTL